MVDEIPRVAERLAVYHIRTESKDFDRGISRYIRSRIENIFRVAGRRTMISSPELKTLKVRSTDTSFVF